MHEIKLQYVEFDGNMYDIVRYGRDYIILSDLPNMSFETVREGNNMWIPGFKGYWQDVLKTVVQIIWDCLPCYNLDITVYFDDVKEMFGLMALKTRCT